MKAIKATCIVFLLSVALIEGGLRVFDPLGVLTYMRDLYTMNAAMYQEDAALGYSHRPGDYLFAHWQASILPDKTRRVVGTDTTARCTIALVGDSVTFAWGVNDADTWASQIAPELPGVHLINTGSAGYNVVSVQKSIAHYRADGYVYLFIDNDDEVLPAWRNAREPSDPAIQLYLYVLQFRGVKPPKIAEFDAALNSVLIDRRVRAVAFAGRSRNGIQSIPMYTKRLSFIDNHADAEGNREIARAMLPILREFSAQMCSVVF